MTCQDFERLLEAWLAEGDPSDAEGLLTRAQRAACARHLAECRHCRELADLGALGIQGTAAVDPGPGFVEEILARTSGAAHRAEAPATHARGGWAGLWPRLVCRPRFAWEAAYLLTLLLAPLVLWAGAPEQTVALVSRAGRAGSAAVATAGRDLTANAADRVGSMGAAAGSELRTFGTRLASSLERGRDNGPKDPNPEKGNAP